MARCAFLWAPVVVLLAVALPHLDQGDFRTDTQWYSAIGLQAWRTGELWSLQAEPGRPYFNKPPLVFWIHGLSLHAGGVNLVAARLPTVLAAALTVLATAWLTRVMAGRCAGLAAGCVLALTIEFVRRTREVSIDLWQTAFFLLAMLAVVVAVRAESRGRRAGMFALAGAALGLALLCKPLMGLIPIAIFAVWLVAVGRARLAPWLGVTLATALAVAGPWHLSMRAMHGRGFVDQYFGQQVADRAAGLVRDSVTSPLFYVEQLATTYWPWGLCVAGAAVLAWRGVLRRGDRRLGLLAALWAVSWLVLLSVFPDRRDRYALPIWPALAMLAGVWCALVPHARVREVLARVRPWVAPGFVLGGVVFAALPVRVQRPADPQWPELYAYLGTAGVDRVWQGGAIAHRTSRLYLAKGWWPTPTRDARGARLAGVEPPAGAVLIYHRHDGLAPGPGEVVVFESTKVRGDGSREPGDLRLTRLEAGPWQPRVVDGLAW